MVYSHVLVVQCVARGELWLGNLVILLGFELVVVMYSMIIRVEILFVFCS